MQFRCRLASPNGEITEGVFVADSETQLRRDMEEKGLYVLSLQDKGALAGVPLALPGRTITEANQWLGEAVAEVGLDPAAAAVAVEPRAASAVVRLAAHYCRHLRGGLLESARRSNP